MPAIASFGRAAQWRSGGSGATRDTAAGDMASASAVDAVRSCPNFLVTRSAEMQGGGRSRGGFRRVEKLATLGVEFGRTGAVTVGSGGEDTGRGAMLCLIDT
jgi:hypothetical protein